MLLRSLAGLLWGLLVLFVPFLVAADERLISLAPSITEIVFELGAGESLVGVSRYCDFPKEAQGIPKVGGFLDPNYEAIVTLKPHLVLLLTEHAEIKRKLEKLGINSVSVDNRSIQNILNSFVTIGKAIGKPEAGVALKEKKESRIEEIAARSKSRERPSVLVTVDGHSAANGLLSAQIAGTETIFNELIEKAGGKNAFQAGKRYSSLSAEGILYLKPDIIIDLVPDAKQLGKTESSVQQEWKNLLRHQNTLVSVVTDEYAVNAGPRIDATLERFSQIISG